MSTEIPSENTESVVVPNQTVCTCCSCATASQFRYYILKTDVISYMNYNDPCSHSYAKGPSFDLVTEFFFKDFDVPENIGAYVCSGCHKKLRKVKVWRVRLQNLINEIKELSQCFIDYKSFCELDLPLKKRVILPEKKLRISSDVDRTASDCKVSVVQPQLPFVKLEPMEQNLTNNASASVSSQQDTVQKRPFITNTFSLQNSSNMRPPNTMTEKKPRMSPDVDRTASNCRVSLEQPQLPFVKLEPTEQNLTDITLASVSSQPDTVNKRQSIGTTFSLQDKTIIRPPNTMTSEQNCIRPANLVSILNKQVSLSEKPMPDHHINIQFVATSKPHAQIQNNKSITSACNTTKPKQNNDSVTTVKIKPVSNQQNIAVKPGTGSIKPVSNLQTHSNVKPVYTFIPVSNQKIMKIVKPLHAIKPVSNQENMDTAKPVNMIPMSNQQNSINVKPVDVIKPVSDQQNIITVKPVHIRPVSDTQNITTVMPDDLQSESNVQNNEKNTPSIINHDLSQQNNTNVMLSGVKSVSSQQVIGSIIKQANRVNPQDNGSVMPPNVITSERTVIMPDKNVIVIQQTSTMTDINMNDMSIQNLSSKPDTIHTKQTPGTHTVNKSSPIINKSSETSQVPQQTGIAKSFHSPSQTSSFPEHNNALPTNRLLCNSSRPTRLKLVKFKSIQMSKDLMPIVKCLADGNICKALQLLLKSDVDYIFEASTKGLSTLIKTEAKEYARNKAKLMEINKTPICDFESFDIKVMQKEFETWTPTLWKCVCSVATSTFTKKFQSPKVCSALSILFHSRSFKLNMLQEYVAVAMYSCGLKKEGFRILSKLGFSVSCIQMDKRPILNTAKIRNLVYMRKKSKNFEPGEDTENEEEDIVLTDHEDIIDWDEADEMLSCNTDININKIPEFTSEESEQLIVNEEELCWGGKSKESLSYSVIRNLLNVKSDAERERHQQE
ncbi:hypothetical protein SNE40_002488 [Patella caerulea]|uniref:Uncharacterized protein n=1 Tax=Patella caerulea TaxID=87958 RepID=A0AAN8K8P3_PATCE